MKQINIIALVLLITLPLSAQIKEEILGKELVYKIYNKRNKEKGTLLYKIKHQSDENYVLSVDTKQKKIGEIDMPLIVTSNNIINRGVLNISALKNTGMPVSSFSGEITYPIEVSQGEVLPKSRVNVVLGENKGMKGTLNLTSERQVIRVTDIDTPLGKLNGYIIDVKTVVEMKMGMINMPALHIKTVEYFCPEIGIPVKTEIYNRNGTKIISRTTLQEIKQVIKG